MYFISKSGVKMGLIGNFSNFDSFEVHISLLRNKSDDVMSVIGRDTHRKYQVCSFENSLCWIKTCQDR